MTKYYWVEHDSEVLLLVVYVTVAGVKLMMIDWAGFKLPPLCPGYMLIYISLVIVEYI